MDGSPWDSCLRTFAKRALEDVRSEMGVETITAFEHEFHLQRPGSRPAPGFTLGAQREAEPFLSRLFSSLDQAGLHPEMILPEYGESQYEVTVEPAKGITGADRAVSLREVVRDTARVLGCRTSFSPVVQPDSVGNGVHMHFSFVDDGGVPTLYDETRPGGLSDVGGSFVAGILAHLPALLALTAASPVSSFRLVPHHWSAAFAAFGEHNREAAVRIAPIVKVGGRDAAAQYNLEFRAADATASPYLVLGALLRAGLEGVRNGEAPPEPLRVDPGDLTEEELTRRGIRRLPSSLEEALDALEADAIVRSWFSDDLWNCYLSLKRTELDLVSELTELERCTRYAGIY
jgi:glutamine synthetase